MLEIKDYSGPQRRLGQLFSIRANIIPFKIKFKLVTNSKVSSFISEDEGLSYINREFEHEVMSVGEPTENEEDEDTPQDKEERNDKSKQTEEPENPGETIHNEDVTEKTAINLADEKDLLEWNWSTLRITEKRARTSTSKIPKIPVEIFLEIARNFVLEEE